MDIISMAYAKKLVNGLQSGLDNASIDNDTCSITFHWKNGTSSTMTFPKPLDGANGVGISDVKLKEVTVGSGKETHLICTLEDGTEIDAGNIPEGTTDYADLTNKPSINSIELSGNKTLADLGITNYDDTQVKADIGKKANATDLTTHTNDTDIHITASERTKWNKAITEDQLQGYIPYFPKTIQFGYEASTTSGAKWVKIFEFTPNKYDWNGGNFIIAFSFLNPANSYYPFSEYELIWECNSDGASGITDAYLKQIINQNGDVCHTNGSALCVGISENKKTVGLYAFLGISTYQTMSAIIISGGSRYENNQSEIRKWINIDKPTVGLEEQPTFSKANYYSLADNLGGWTYTATKLISEVDNKIEALETSQNLEYESTDVTCNNTLASRTSDMFIKGKTYVNLGTGGLESAGQKENKISILSNNNKLADDIDYKEYKKEILLPVEGGLKSLSNGICDTIEQRTDGVYLVQKIGKYDIKENDEIKIDSSPNQNNTIAFLINVNANNIKTSGNNNICNNFNRFTSGDVYWNSDIEGILNSKNSQFKFRILKSKLSTQNIDGIKAWLKANPTTVCYETNTPIETKLDINNLDLEVYEGTTYITTENAIQPTLSFKVPSNLGGIIQANSQNINELYKLIDEVIIPQLINNSADIEVLKLK